MISGDDDLLFPRFYLRSELKDWIFDVVPSTSELNRSWKTASATVVNLFVHSTRSLPGIPYEVDSILSTDRCHSLQIRRLIWRGISELRNRLLKTTRLADDQEFPWNIAYILEPEGMFRGAMMKEPDFA